MIKHNFKSKRRQQFENGGQQFENGEKYIIWW
jgi:hypothetical protein